MLLVSYVYTSNHAGLRWPRTTWLDPCLAHLRFGDAANCRDALVKTFVVSRQFVAVRLLFVHPLNGHGLEYSHVE